MIIVPRFSTKTEVWIVGREVRVAGNAKIKRFLAMDESGKVFEVKDFNGLKGARAVGLEYFDPSQSLVGYSKTYHTTPFGFDLEIVPRELNDGSLRLEVVYRGRRVPCELKVRCGNKLTVMFSDGLEEVELKRGLNVITAKFCANDLRLVTTMTVNTS